MPLGAIVVCLSAELPSDRLKEPGPCPTEPRRIFRLLLGAKKIRKRKPKLTQKEFAGPLAQGVLDLV